MMVTMMITMNIMFLFLKHPMSMGLILILQTMMVAMYTGTMMKSFWISYMMVIIILSGMLVLFIYMASIASNEKFKVNKKLWVILSITALILSTIMYNMDSEILMKKTLNSSYFPLVKNSEILFMQKMFTNENMYIIIFLMLYLLYTMIVVNYLVNAQEGTMKTKYN